MESIPEFRHKIGRNDQCPCGSKKKFKSCHGHHSAPPDPNFFQVAAKVRSLASKSECFAPVSLHDECSKGTINAHTVSRSGSLGSIQRDGHVYSYNFDMQALRKQEGHLRPEATGWKQASTFPGFCGHHDKRLFEPLEDAPFIGSREQCFLIAYRSLAKELHAKVNSAKQNDLRAAIAGRSAEVNGAIAAFNKGNSLALRDLRRHKKRYDKVLVNKDWASVRGLLIEFIGTFPIQCTGGLFPDRDVNGQFVQRLGLNDATPDTINLASFAANGTSYFLICWLADSDHSGSRFAAPFELVNKDQLPAVIATLILQRTENCHFAPDWYDGLSEFGKKWCEENGLSGMFWGDRPPAIKAADTSLFPGIGVAGIRWL